MVQPLVFISHKHNDRAIANVVRSFITERTSSKVRVFQSSEPSALTPGIGRTLNTELIKALWEAAAVILIYTVPDEDWSYCMWECGVAMQPNSPDTRIILLQCCDTAPSLFDGQLGVKARDRKSIQVFATQFMTQANFLPGTSDPLTGYDKVDPTILQAANKLFDDLQAVIPKGSTVGWHAHPYIQLKISDSSKKKIAEAPSAERQTIAKQVILAEASISDSDKQAESLFGTVDFDEELTLAGLYEMWRSVYPEYSSDWIESLTDQLSRAAQGKLPILRWSAMPSVDDKQLHTPVVTEVRTTAMQGDLQVDIYFYPFSLLEATPTQSRMVHRSEMLCRVLMSGGEKDVIILELLRELDSREYRRMPFLDPDDRLVYIIHRSMLDQFISRRTLQGKVSDLQSLSLADMLTEEPKLRALFSNTAAFVERDSTLAEAIDAMESIPQCYDVFVTNSGDASEPVLGWLTDVIISSVRRQMI